MGYIKSTFIDKLLDRAHIDEVIGKYLELKRAGANFKAKSPFSDDKTASLMVSPVKKIWKDFSSGKGGNVVNFVMEAEPCTYPEAIEKIAGIYNEVVEYEAVEFSEKKKEVLEKKEELRKVLKATHELYQKQLLALPEEHAASQEVKIKRQYSDDTVLEWGIGFAPDNFLYNKLSASGKVHFGEALGLVMNQWDKLSNRVVYPIHDGNGLIIGLAGRDVSGKTNTAKWINPNVDASNLLYNKSKVWYGLHKAKMEIRKRGEAFLNEGYNDVIAAHLYGLENTIASCGTSITEMQINEIKKLCSKVVFWMDPDKAGKAAVLKQIPLFIKQGFRTEVIYTDLDPDDFCRKYSDVIALAGGLNDMFKVPGIRKDGFGILVNEFIKKDYYEIEENLILEKEILQNEILEFESEKQALIQDRNKIETDFLTVDNLLKEIVITKGKKSEEYKDQQITTAAVKSNLDKIKNQIKNLQEPIQLKKQRVIVSDLALKFDTAYKNAEINRASGAKELCKIIINIDDDAYFQIYLNWIQLESKLPKSTINSWIKELRSEIETPDEEYHIDYVLPVDVKIPLKELEKNIKHYGMFIANNQIYMTLPESRDGKVYFSSISNFSIEVLQHMNDEKFPRKLIRLKNIHNKEVIFDTNSENLNTPLNFYNTMSGHGNFNFKGSNNDLQILRTFLLDNMGDGRKIEVLGWQPDANIWVWNNRIINEEGIEIVLDENGVFVFNDIHYYIASANKIYKHTSGKYKAQKQFRVMENPVSFESYMAKVIRVHREHGISALLFAIASLFQDIAVDETGSFPILFFYGPGGSGKDELAYIVQSFAGIPQIPINLEAGASTLKAKIIELAQFKNGISQLSEYKRGDSKLDGTIKSIWDRVGYKKGSIESRIAMDTVDIESSVILTGNDYPNSEPLIIRLIWNEMNKNVFSQEEMVEFDELNDWTTKGVSGYSHHLMTYRKVYKENYSKGYRKWKGILQENFKTAKGRIISNLAVLATTFEIVRDMTDTTFPFDQNAMMDHFKNQIEHQTSKINSASVMIRFWDCFIASLRGNKDERLQANYIVSVEENTLYIQWTHTMDKIERKWWTQYHELPPSRATFKDELKKSGAWIEDIKSHSFASGRMANRSSATSINMLQLSENVREDITGSIMYQLNEGTLWENKAKDGSETDQEPPLPLKWNEIEGTDADFL
jgi:DNA primase catalytic core